MLIKSNQKKQEEKKKKTPTCLVMLYRNAQKSPEYQKVQCS